MSKALPVSLEFAESNTNTTYLVIALYFLLQKKCYKN